MKKQIKDGFPLFKKRSLNIIFFILIVISSLFFVRQQFVKGQDRANDSILLNHEKEPHFWVISDNHFYSDDLFEDSERFRKFEATTIGTDIRYTTQVLTAFVQKALDEKPTGIIITGDTTLNGEKRSLEHMTEIFEPLSAAGIAVLAIPGNHDIYNGWARKFINGQQITEHQISPIDFKQAFSDGYQMSQSEDKASLSYVVDLKEYRLVMLDSNIYPERFSKMEPITKGKLSEKTLEWLEKILIEAQMIKKTPILFMHHNLLAHNEAVTEGFVLDNADQLLRLVEQYNVPLAMTGHIHLQNIMQDSKNPNFYEISTSSFSTAGSHIGHLKLQDNKISYEVEAFDPRPYFTEKQLENSDLSQYPEFLANKYRQVGEKMAMNFLIQSGIEEDAASLAKMVGEANLRYFTGNNLLSEMEKEAIYHDPRYQILKEFAPSLSLSVENSVEDSNIPNNHSIVIEIQ